MKGILALGFSFCLMGNLAVAETNLNIAVFGGGGGNTYAGLFSAEEFSRHAKLPFHELFDQGWGLSGGTFSAQILMDGRWHGNASEIAKAGIGAAFPEYGEFLDPVDTTGIRAQKLEKILEPHFKDQTFGSEKKAKVVFIGSLKGAPVFFCDKEIKLADHELRCAEGTSVIDGIMCSSTYSYRFFGQARLQVSLFKPRQILIEPIMGKKTIVDGTHCDPKRVGKFVLDGSTPTPLVIEYLSSIPGEHNVVVFDNGGPVDHEFRKSINVNELGTTSLVQGSSRISVFIISISVKNFATNFLNGSQAYVEYLERQVKKAIQGPSRTAFFVGLQLVMKNKAHLYKTTEPNRQHDIGTYGLGQVAKL